MREQMRRELVKEIGGDWPNWDRVERTARRVVENQRYAQESAGFRPLTGGVATASAAAEYVTERDDLRRWNDYNDTSRYVERPRAGPATASDLEQKLAKDTDKRERYRKIYMKALNPNGSLKPSPKAKFSENFEIARLQRDCNHYFKDLQWGSNGKAVWAQCNACNLKSVCAYIPGESSKSQGSVSYTHSP